MSPMVYVSMLSSTALFALLMMGVSSRYTDIRQLSTWADAKSFAHSMATRAHTSADCFAYETGAIKYSEGSETVQSQRKVKPGVIDIRKFTRDRYFDCVQSYYFTGASRRAILKGVRAHSAAFIEFELKDLEQPGRVSMYGENTLSTEPQLGRQGAIDKYIESKRQYIKAVKTYGDWILMGVSVGLDLAIGAATGGAVEIDPDFIVLPGRVMKFNILRPALIERVKERESIYTYTTPVTIRYIKDGEYVTDHIGMLKTKIHYSAYGKG